MSFNPLAVENDIQQRNFPKSARQYAMDIGVLTNAHFLAIQNSYAIPAAQVVINFLLFMHKLKKQIPRYAI